MGKSAYCFCQIQACGLVKVEQNRYVSVCTKGFSEGVENGFALRGEATKNENGFPGNRVYDITNFWVVQQQVNELCDLKVIDGNGRFFCMCDDQIVLFGFF